MGGVGVFPWKAFPEATGSTTPRPMAGMDPGEGRVIARILATGDELVGGAKVDTNSAWLAGELSRGRGIAVDRIELCGDGVEENVRALRGLAGEGVLLLVTGGLGPTGDDRTREAVARVAGVELVEDRAGRERLRARLAGRGIPWSPSQGRQVLHPAGFTPLPNPVGQALGFQGVLAGAETFVLPGVPVELKAMFREEVLPRLPRGADQVLVELTAAGVPEAVIGERLASLLERPEPVLGMTAEGGVVVIRIRARGPGAVARAEAAAGEVERLLGPRLAGRGRLALHQVVGRLLVERGITLATAESCTGGWLAGRLVSFPGISRVFRGGVVAYADQAKTEWVGVPSELILREGAVSEAVARALAEGAAGRTGARLGIGVTGIAGPGGAVAGKPVGTVYLALCLDGDCRVQRFTFQGDRDEVRRSTVRTALRLVLERVREVF